MATFTVSGRSLSRISRRANIKAAWLRKLVRNASRKLNRLGDLVTMTPGSLYPGETNHIVLVYIGPAQSIPELSRDMVRIQKVLGVEFRPNNTATVKFCRITVEVEIRLNFIKEKQVA